jgi:hypothetical protein
MLESVLHSSSIATHAHTPCYTHPAAPKAYTPPDPYLTAPAHTRTAAAAGTHPPGCTLHWGHIQTGTPPAGAPPGSTPLLLLEVQAAVLLHSRLLLLLLLLLLGLLPDRAAVLEGNRQPRSRPRTLLPAAAGSRYSLQASAGHSPQGSGCHSLEARTAETETDAAVRLSLEAQQKQRQKQQ